MRSGFDAVFDTGMQCCLHAAFNFTMFAPVAVLHFKK